MKYFLTLLSLCTLALSLTRCATKAPTATATAAAATPEEKVAEVKRSYTDAQLEEGKLIWQGSCKKCHALFTPESRGVEKWENVLPRMAKRAKLDDTAAAKVRAYLLTHAKAG